VVRSIDTGEEIVLLRPEVPIHLYGPAGTVEVVALVDTGADNSIFPLSIARDLGIETTEGKGPAATAFGGQQIALSFADVVLELSQAGSRFVGRAVCTSPISRATRRRRSFLATRASWTTSPRPSTVRNVPSSWNRTIVFQLCEFRVAAAPASAEAAKPMCKKEWRRFDYGHAFSVLRKRFEELVGWYRRPQDPILNSDGAWQVVFARIFDEIYGP
jgi:hypothetical protein